MPTRCLFFRSLSPELGQSTITASIHTRLSFRTPRPDTPAIPIKIRRQELAGSRHMVGGINGSAVVGMFQAYCRDFRY